MADIQKEKEKLFNLNFFFTLKFKKFEIFLLPRKYKIEEEKYTH